MATRFDHQEIERKWQARWKETESSKNTLRDERKEKKFVLVEFPYPSGNLHIGHWYAFAVPDIYVRALRMQGKQVLFPIGFDSFGLPAENAAIKRKLDPKKWTYDNIAYMKTQLESMGNSFDWERMVITSDPDYYRWTQWLFLEFFKRDLAYRGIGMVNWCPSCNTVLANEQVLNDTCERCNTKIELREMPEWKLKITDYADRLVDDLDPLPWPEHIKDLQRNWIGRSYGAEISFKLSTDDEITVFTTRPDTLYGATFLVVAPEHKILETLKPAVTNWAEVEACQKAAAQKDEIERTSEGREKTGVRLKGITATNPGSGEEIPVFIADYVLARYGTGAIMAVPAHDERDAEFARNFNLLFKSVITADGVQIIEEVNGIKNNITQVFAENGVLVNSVEFNGLTSEEAKEKIVEKIKGKWKSAFKMRDWSIGRQRYWGVPIPIVYDPEGNPHAVPAEHLPWRLPEDVDFAPTGEPPLAKSEELKKRTTTIFGEGWTPEVETMDTFVDSSWYFMRYTDPKNEREFASYQLQKEWLPVDIYFGGAEHTTMHLLYSRFVQKALFDFGLSPFSEPYTLRINRGLVLGPDGQKMSKSKGNVIDPDEQVSRLGADTVRMYLAFMGPYGHSTNYPWDLGGIAGIRRFLERVYDLKNKIIITESATDTLIHHTIKKVTNDVALYKFNTAISTLMVFLNAAEKNGLNVESYGTYLRLLAPFAPHLTDELWEISGHTVSIHEEPWPVANEALATADEVTLAVQINGKTRGTVTVPYNAEETKVVEKIKSEAALSEKLGSAPWKKVIFVPNKIINILV